MAKTLQRYGNSLAIVIEKPIRRALGLGTKTKLKVWTDGRRIIIEPLPDVFEAEKPDDELRLRLDASGVISRLVNRHGLDRKHFAQLDPSGTPVFAWMTRTELWRDPDEPISGEELALMRRLEVLLLDVQQGTMFDVAIPRACQRVPVTCRDNPKS